MTLNRQLAILLTGLILVVFAGALAINLVTARQQLERELAVRAQETATFLSLALTPAVVSGDRQHVGAVIDSVFEPGGYQAITVIPAGGARLTERRASGGVNGVPSWFVGAVPIQGGVGESEVISNWQRAAVVNVVTNPAQAHRDMWRMATRNFWWFTLGAVGTLLVLYLVLTIVLRPLRAVERQALAVAARDFRQLPMRPRTRELRRVVEAMNQMAARVKETLADYVELAENMRREAFEDPVTHLDNRRAFDAHLGYLVDASERFTSGALYLVEIPGLRSVNETEGYERGDEVLREVARALQSVVNGHRQVMVARLGGAMFGIVFEELAWDTVTEVAEQLVSRLRAVSAGTPGTGVASVHVGVARQDGSRDAAGLLADADRALQQARESGEGPAWALHQREGETATDRVRERTERVREALASGAVQLAFQPVRRRADRTVLHVEALARLAGEGGAPVPAATFMPVVERLGLGTHLDRAVVHTALESLPPEGEVRVAVNVSRESVGDASFGAWLSHTLEGYAGRARRLAVEIAEHAALADPHRAAQLAELLHERGMQLGLDHFGLAREGLLQLPRLRPDYVKLDGSFSHHLDGDRENRFYVQAMAGAAHQLGITVIAESIEREEEWEALAGLGVDAGQGYWLGRPEEFPAG